MTQVLITRSKLDGLATAISAKSGEPLPLTIDEMEDAVDGIDTGGGGNDFVITLSYNDQTEMWEPDKTLAEIDAAYLAGKNIVAQSADVYAVRGQYDEFSSAYYYTIYRYDYGTVETKLVEDNYYLDGTGVHADLTLDYYDTSAADAIESDVAEGKAFFNDSGYHEGTYVTPTARTSSDVTVSGDTVTVPAGAYSSQVTKSVASGTAGTPTATKGAVSNHAVSVTPSVTNTTGYITGGTKTGTAVSVSASELVSGTYTVSASGSHDVTNYASASVAAGSASAPSTISGTSATVSTGTNTLTLSKTVSVTPTVSAGYVSSGTATNSAVSLTASVTTQAAQTIYPSASDQTIAASRYLTGAQTIKAVTTSNLTAENIKSGVTVTVGDSSDADRVLSVTGTYSGGGGGIGTLLTTYSMGTISTSSTQATDTGKSISVSGVDNYDLLIVETSVNTVTNNRHTATVGLIFLTASSTVGTKNGAAIATMKWNSKISSQGVTTTRQGTTAYGIYPNSCSVATSNNVTTATIPMYQRYNSTSTGTINGTYTARVYGVNLYDLIGG